MKLYSPTDIQGTATLLKPWPLWRVATDTKTANLAAGTKFAVIGKVIYHKSAAVPNGWPGFLVAYQNELYVLPAGSTTTSFAAYVDPTPYSKSQLDAAVTAAVTPLRKVIAAIKTALGA